MPEVAAAIAALSAPGHPVVSTNTSVPAKPGLYAVHGDASTWQTFGLGVPPDDRPLYVGKAERSLLDRDVSTHFATGETGRSTLRRSVAALLANELALHGMPRNPAKHGYFDKYGLEPAGDQRLTDWMLAHLRLAVWPASPGIVLADVETAVLQRLMPPLNLDKVTTPWRRQIRAARATLADQARRWHPAP